MANLNRRNNIVESLAVDGFVSLDATKIIENTLQFYTHLYSKQFIWQPKLDGLFFNSVDAKEASWLERSFEEHVLF